MEEKDQPLPERKIKYYEPEYVVKMLPYISCYCRDLEDTYNEILTYNKLYKKLSGLTILSNKDKIKIEEKQEEVESRQYYLIKSIKQWDKELAGMHMSICSLKLGRINVPIFDNDTESIINLCLHKKTDKSSLEWHSLQDDFEKAHPYWYKFVPHNRLMIPHCES